MAMFQKNGEWYIDYYINGRRKREMVGPSKKLAQDVLNKRKVQIAENRFLDIKKDQKIKFRDFATTYIETHAKPNKRSWQSGDIHYIKHMNNAFGARYLYEITSVLVEKYKIERNQHVSVATVNRELACLKCMFNKAIDWGMAKENPVRKIKLFKENNARIRFLEKEEISKLLNVCSSKLRAIVLLALNTGMRKAEIQGLKWRDVNFQERFIILELTKNGEKRIIPINNIAKAALFSVEKHPESPYIFCGDSGIPFNFRKAFNTAIRKAGIEDFRFHDLRHTFASHLVMTGVDLNTVRELMGHKSLNMTLRYSHLSVDHKSRAVDILGKKMDTIWTPNAVDGNIRKDNNVTTILELTG